MTDSWIDSLQNCNVILSEKLQSINNFSEFNQLKSEFLGKNSELNKLFAEAKMLSPEQFKAMADTINKYRSDWGKLFQVKQAELKLLQEQTKLEQDAIDVTLPAKMHKQGSYHPVTIVKRRLATILARLGYIEVDGPEIEDEFHNFTALNVAEFHPARGMQDTFYLQNVAQLLRTQTSSIQIHELKKQKLPLKIISPGKVYRRDSDQTHSPMFHQLELLNVAEGCNFSELKAVLIYTFRELFGQELKFRFRPSYFPFTEPSGELDIEWRGRWLEVAGYGMVHPNVLTMQGIDTIKYSGYAFGVGIDRLAMILFGIDDLRLLFQNDIRFLAQFSGDAT